MANESSMVEGLRRENFDLRESLSQVMNDSDMMRRNLPEMEKDVSELAHALRVEREA